MQREFLNNVEPILLPMPLPIIISIIDRESRSLIRVEGCIRPRSYSKSLIWSRSSNSLVWYIIHSDQGSEQLVGGYVITKQLVKFGLSLLFADVHLVTNVSTMRLVSVPISRHTWEISLYINASFVIANIHRYTVYIGLVYTHNFLSGCQAVILLFCDR